MVRILVPAHPHHPHNADERVCGAGHAAGAGVGVGYDVIVVGGGTAGCVLAARLSADERRLVLLVEAGPDYPVVADLPADIADESMPTTSHDWGFVSDPDELGRSVPLPRGRLVGGCSATNACFALRGWPVNYDEWVAKGNPGWSFADLLPVFRAIESDADFGGDCHGSHGPVRSADPRPVTYRPSSGPSLMPRSPSATRGSATTTGQVPWVSVRDLGTCVTGCA